MSQDQRTNARLMELIRRTGYRLVNGYGERIFGSPPPGWNRPKPLRDAEIFVWKLPRDCYEDEIVPPFGECGRIYELKLKMEFNGKTRGYCSIMYATPEEANLAVSMLNNYEIRPGNHIEVVHSRDHLIYVSNFPPNKAEDEILQVIQGLTKDVVFITFCEKYTSGFAEPVQFALVNYSDHYSAAMAKSTLIHELNKLWNCDISVQWSSLYLHNI